MCAHAVLLHVSLFSSRSMYSGRCHSSAFLQRMRFSPTASPRSVKERLTFLGPMLTLSTSTDAEQHAIIGKSPPGICTTAPCHEASSPASGQGLDLRPAPTGPYGSETEVLLRCPHNTLHSISPLEMAYLPCHTPLGFDSHGMNSSPLAQRRVSGLLPAVSSCHPHCFSLAPASFLLLPHHSWLFLPAS